MGRTFSRPLSQQQDPNRVEPARKPGLALLEKEEVKTQRPGLWNIVLYNDDLPPMDFFEFVLKTVFHISTLDALALTLAVHTKGKGIAGTYTFEVAEEKQSGVLLIAKRLTENEWSDFGRLWHDGCSEAIIEAQDVDRNHSPEV